MVSPQVEGRIGVCGEPIYGVEQKNRGLLGKDHLDSHLQDASLSSLYVTPAGRGAGVAAEIFRHRLTSDAGFAVY